MYADPVEEARRQAQICNSCRYCEGYCAVFPSMHINRFLADGDLAQLANLCHNCQNCYDACQYTAPHEFALNLPGVLAEVRQDSWEQTSFPAAMGTAFHRHGTLIGLVSVLAMALLFWAARSLPGDGEGFYAVIGHNAMIAIFLPAFLFPLLALFIGISRYWELVGAQAIRLSDITAAFGSAATMRNLAGGHGDGCNYEDGDRFSHKRRYLHQLVMYGFLLCFAATASGTILHYVFDLPAPYGLFSIPKALGIPGGLMLCVGTLGLMWIKAEGRPNLQDPRVRGGEFGFILLLFVVSLTGLLLYALRDSAALELLLALHLGSVLAFFLLTPYSKMAHGFYRLAALVRDAQRRRSSR
ncbi:tricarballylate utilization 4Fe-4S protein TcuB [Aliihoeflea aestuarii]|jgi:citrate/tricarballylate utilization protein|uniref:tricarballylate utilization 4Fe-4S protein TcuB n=1 Tax=Aliihoeflea aestuarii TaxID=453840 RepID=UPI0020939FF2|nr:tricarballylate utilization 4Fe-4S protein TcuB [Aliihoeflea aestuarii]MCO6390102.1 tricarballylate utilization 4Fe-4S protein TcuB [Aliihoeflea aestuarii]